jgi:hypothetical protein
MDAGATGADGPGGVRADGLGDHQQPLGRPPQGCLLPLGQPEDGQGLEGRAGIASDSRGAGRRAGGHGGARASVAIEQLQNLGGIAERGDPLERLR